MVAKSEGPFIVCRRRCLPKRSTNLKPGFYHPRFKSESVIIFQSGATSAKFVQPLASGDQLSAVRDLC
jgi:hypothetical protein